MTNVNLNVTGNSINPQMDAGLDLDDSDVNYDDITSQRWGMCICLWLNITM